MNDLVEKLGPAPRVTEVAEFLKMHVATVYRLMYGRKLRKISGFGTLRICPQSIREFLGRTVEHEPKQLKRVEVSE